MDYWHLSISHEKRGKQIRSKSLVFLLINNRKAILTSFEMSLVNQSASSSNFLLEDSTILKPIKVALTGQIAATTTTLATPQS